MLSVVAQETRESTIHPRGGWWSRDRANHSNREAGMTMRWRLTAAMVSSFIFKAANQRLSYALLWERELEPNIACAF